MGYSLEDKDNFFKINQHNMPERENRSNKTVFKNQENQKQFHRTIIVIFSVCVGGIGTVLFSTIVVAQMIIRLTRDNYSVLDGNQLEFLGTAILLQAFGIILFITRSLWSEKNINQPMIEKEFEDDRQNKDKAI